MKHYAIVSMGAGHNCLTTAAHLAKTGKSVIDNDGTSLQIKGKTFRTMPMTAVLKSEQARKVFALLNLQKILFLIMRLFKQSKQLCR